MPPGLNRSANLQISSGRSERFKTLKIQRTYLLRHVLMAKLIRELLATL